MKEDKPDATPREWWIDVEDNAWEGPKGFEEALESDKCIHVIEKSAYDALKQRVAELERQLDNCYADRGSHWKNEFDKATGEYGTMLDEIAAVRADSKRLSDAIQDGIDNCCKHTDRIAELEGQLKAKVSMDAVVIADGYEARIAELEADRKMVTQKWIDQREREQKLVAFIQSLADGIMADGDHVDTSVSMNAQLLLEALAEHKGGG